MAELLSIGLDVGTTSTQLILSRLQVENQGSSFTVPRLQISKREVLYRSSVYFTPLVENELVDTTKLRALVEEEYQKAGITKEQVDTGAVIITGETSRKENARAVLRELSDLAGDFVVATAGPDLESVLAAKGAGAVSYSETSGKTVLHVDIGGGTSNFALIEDGKITSTGCLNVGGRLVKLDGAGTLTYVSPVLEGIFSHRVGERPAERDLKALAQTLASALEMAAGLRPATALLEELTTREVKDRGVFPMKAQVLSFSGGVADCIEKDHPPLAFGDLGPELGKAIRESALCKGEYRLGEETIRATVIGAGSHSAMLSGSTVFHRDVEFPLKNLQAVTITAPEQSLAPEQLAKVIREKLRLAENGAALALPGFSSPGYDQVQTLARGIIQGLKGQFVPVALEADMAKALGHAMALQTKDPILCIDGVMLQSGSFLDIGKPVGPALPVVVKTLILEKSE